MDFEPVILEGFDGRETALAEVARYVHPTIPIMFYRTDDLVHSQRVLWHLEEGVPDIISVYGNNFDVDFARTLALVHDDVEIITGDVTLYDKEHMEKYKLNALAEEERKAIPSMIKMYNAIANGHDYGTLLFAAKGKDSLEAQFVSFFDKFDGSGEACHEVWAGNELFVLVVAGNNGQSGGYVRRLNEFPSRYPAMTEFFEQFPEYLPKPFNFKSVAERSKPHTAESLQQDSGYRPYERWKRTVMELEGIDRLVRQVEFQL